MFKRFIVRVIIVAAICLVGYVIGEESSALGVLIVLCGIFGGTYWIVKGLSD